MMFTVMMTVTVESNYNDIDNDGIDDVNSDYDNVDDDFNSYDDNDS